ncbi:Ig-like domain-containing protein [Rheinheimera aquimaris]|uniref:Ig-like domain-containing protein n=1 Tax=Rheinheimera aquimaris TaxID=412437 RepID=UPI001E324A18|nr:Ig-like domain-containing protein [Rheinheimera aquimaris]MCD1597952.1 Ig-like domain-containing protein [Rheinheimera aquimaris]
MRNIQQLLVALIVTTLAACGGGGTLDSDGGNGGGGNNTPVYSLAVSLTNADGTASNALAQATPLTVTATLTATNNGVVSGRVIQFGLSNEALATFGNTAGSAVTNAQGVATISLLAGNSSGAGTVTATYNDATAEAAFNSAGDGGDTVDITVGSVALIADTLQLGSSTASKVELTALVRDTNNVVLADVPVNFSSDSGELVQIDSVTGENGVARATLTTQTNKNNRDIKVMARVQQQSSELTVSVVGTAIEVAAPDSVVLADSTTIDMFLTDSNGAGIQGVEIEVTSSLGNTLSDTSPATSGNAGKASFTYTAVNSGTDTLTVTALGATNSVVINISADAFAFIDTDTEDGQVLEVDLNTAQALNVEWLVNNTANVGQEVTFNTTRGVIADSAANLATSVTSSDVTDAEGKAQAFVRSQFAGLATISAVGGEGSDAVSAKKVIEFVAVNPTKVETQAFPAQVGAGESSTVRAIVRDANNNPVKNQVVVFSLDNSAGGTISTGTAVTNSQGVASTVFTADTTTGGGVNGLNLVIRASLQSNNAVFDVTDIAVGERTLFFRFGTGNVITKPSDSTYAKEFSIVVTDSSGNAVPNQQLNVAVSSIGYRKGYWVPSPPAPETFKIWIPSGTLPPAAWTAPQGCVSEDTNFNGILDAGEDINGDGQLTPGNFAVVPGVVTSDENGIVSFNITYPQDVGSWLDVRLQVSGFAAGTENISFREYGLPTAAEDLTTETSRPAGNPFGVAQSCAISD